MNRLIFTAAMVMASGAAGAQTAGPSNTTAPNPARDALYVRSLAATCANCHGTNGKAVVDSSVVTLAGMPKDYIVLQMKAFKAGTRPATVMHQLSKGYSDAQIAVIAAHFAAQKK